MKKLLVFAIIFMFKYKNRKPNYWASVKISELAAINKEVNNYFMESKWLRN